MKEEKDYKAIVRHTIEMARGDIPYSEIARRTGQSPQNLYGKLKTCRIRAWEMFEVLDAIKMIKKESR